MPTYTPVEWQKLLDINIKEGTSRYDCDLFTVLDTNIIKNNLNKKIGCWDETYRRWTSYKHLHHIIFDKKLHDMPLLINDKSPVVRAVAMWRLTLGK